MTSSPNRKNINQKPFPKKFGAAMAISGVIGFVLGIVVARKRDGSVNTLGQSSVKLKDLLQQREARIALLYKHIADLEGRLAEFERRHLRSPWMLSEDIYVRQIEGEPKRRWFSDAEFDLIVWFNKERLSPPQKNLPETTPPPQESRS